MSFSRSILSGNVAWYDVLICQWVIVDSSPSGLAGSDYRIPHSRLFSSYRRIYEGSGVLDQSRKDVQCQMKSLILRAETTTRIGTWNVQTLYQVGKLAQLLRELDAYQLDILGVSEMKWTGSGRMHNDGRSLCRLSNIHSTSTAESAPHSRQAAVWCIITCSCSSSLAVHIRRLAYKHGRHHGGGNAESNHGIEKQ